MAMNVIARKALQVFWKRYPQAEMPLQFKTALIKFVGTHEEYDRIDAEAV